MVKPMAPNPIIFALANPDPEIDYDVALAARPDAIVATGRSDFPNQVNNVLGFPFIFRGALDVRATTINEEMKLAATRALASLAKEDVPDSVLRAYGCGPHRVRPRVHHPQTVRSARAHLGSFRGGASRHGERRGPSAGRHPAVPRRRWSAVWAPPTASCAP
jgi:malic enzyme